MGSLRGRLFQSTPFPLFILSSGHLFSHIILRHNTTSCIMEAHGPPGTSCLILFAKLLNHKPKLKPLSLSITQSQVFCYSNKKWSKQQRLTIKLPKFDPYTWFIVFFPLKILFCWESFLSALIKIIVIFYYWIASCDFSGSPRWSNTVSPYSYLFPMQSSCIFRFILTI